MLERAPPIHGCERTGSQTRAIDAKDKRASDVCC